jgi:hypothetical protein
VKYLIAIMIVLTSAWSADAEVNQAMQGSISVLEAQNLPAFMGQYESKTREVSICDVCDKKTEQTSIKYFTIQSQILEGWVGCATCFSFGGVRFCDDCMKIVGEILKEKLKARKRPKKIRLSPNITIGNEDVKK